MKCMDLIKAVSHFFLQTEQSNVINYVLFDEQIDIMC